HALAQLRLVRRVGREELAALGHCVDARRDVGVVHARAEEPQLPADGRVLRRARLSVHGQPLAGHRPPPVPLPLQAGTRPPGSAPQQDALRQVDEQLFDRGDADRLEHRLPVGVGQREVAHPCSARCCLYASTSISASASDGSLRRTRTSHPAAYGSSFTVSGAPTTPALTSSTSPESGAITSETALTDSTSAYDWSFVTVEPASGGSKCTSSPSESAANHVIPNVASPSSIRAQSCSGW